MVNALVVSVCEGYNGEHTYCGGLALWHVLVVVSLDKSVMMGRDEGRCTVACVPDGATPGVWGDILGGRRGDGSPHVNTD